MPIAFVFRWSLRDLRRRWLQVLAIALVLGIGSGLYSSLGSTSVWRTESYDASFEALAMHDLRVRAAEGADAPTGELLAALEALPDPGVVAAATERLVLPTQVDASVDGDVILVPGRIIGVDLADAGPSVNKLYVEEGLGRPLTGDDSGAPVALLERNFASYYDLPAAGELRLAGGHTLGYVGQVLAPEYLFVVTEEGGIFAQANFAAVFVSLRTAQELTGRSGRVNDLVLRLEPGADRAAVAADLDAELRSRLPELGTRVTFTEDEDAYRILYDDIEGDQQLWNIFAGLILVGASFGAFNLASRMVEASRRELGIGMALGFTTRQLALRPLLVGVQIAVAGAALGVLVGLGVIEVMRPVYVEMLPMPVWRMEFQPQKFTAGALLGFVIPLAATAWPVWRAVRVMPVDAIATTHRNAKGGMSRLLRRIPWPASAFRRMPVGNVLRTPRRTLLTALGIGAAIATLVSVLGMLDSFLDTMDRSDAELLGEHPDRTAVALDGFVPADGPELAAIRDAASVGAAEPVLRVGARASRPGHDELDLLLELSDLSSDLWHPTLERSAPTAGAGILLAAKAAADLGVGPGDFVALEHPARRGFGYEIVTTQIQVAGVHANPLRMYAYMDRSAMDIFGIEGVTNQVYVLPSAGYGIEQVQRELFEMEGVASVQPVATTSRLIEDVLDEFAAILQIMQGFILVLALLIAYNTTSINADERARERATLFAFGLPLRRVLGLEVAEGLVIGLVGTSIGVVTGLAILRWVLATITARTVPEIGFDVVVSSSTIITAAVLGVLAVAVAPLLTIRRLRRMNIPATLRIVE